MKNKDWTGGSASVFKGISASNHADGDRVAQDYYATEPKATEWLLKLEHFDGPILEPACGEGHIAEVLTRGGVFRHFQRYHRSRLWRSGRLSGYRQRGMVGRYHHKPTLRLCSGVCGESLGHYPHWSQSGNVPQTHFPRR